MATRNLGHHGWEACALSATELNQFKMAVQTRFEWDILKIRIFVYLVLLIQTCEHLK